MLLFRDHLQNCWSRWGICFQRASLVAQMVECLPAMLETWVRSLGCEDPLEKEMATHLVSLPGKSHGQRNLAGYSPWGCKESDTFEWLYLLTYFLLPKHSSLTRKRWASLFILCLVKIAFLHVDLQFQHVEYQVLMGKGLPSSLIIWNSPSLRWNC